jgi:[ribosomal protein S5]-alanine N-acetyltransferase
MTEASKAVTDYWFETLERPVLRAPKAATNARSRRIAERSGMRLIKTQNRDYLSGRLPSELRQVTRAEWRRQRGLAAARRETTKNLE